MRNIWTFLFTLLCIDICTVLLNKVDLFESIFHILGYFEEGILHSDVTKAAVFFSHSHLFNHYLKSSAVCHMEKEVTGGCAAERTLFSTF